MLDARYRKRVFRTIKKISLHDILTFDTGLPRFDLSLSCRINASYRSKRGLHEYKKELRINAEFNYQLSLSLSLCSFSSRNSRPVEVASNGLATSGVASVFSTAIFLSFLPPCSEYPRSSADINWPKR